MKKSTKPQVIVIHERDVHGTFSIGSITVLKGTVNAAELLIQKHFGNFIETQFNTDSEYIDFLIKKFPKVFAWSSGDHHNVYIEV
jgi:hypothetical protein